MTQIRLASARFVERILGSHFWGLAAGVVTFSSLTATAQVTPFLDDFTGPVLDGTWTKISAGSHPGFNGAGQYVVNGVLNGDSGLTGSSAGSGSYVAEVSVALGPFALGGSGGTKSDFKFRFNGAAGFVEVVFNSFKDLRVYSSQLGGNLAAPINLGSFVDGDTLRLQLNYSSANSAVDAKYAINNNSWQNLASASGINSVIPGTSDLVLFKWDNSPATLPQMRLDRYEIRVPAPVVNPTANPDAYQTLRDTPLVVSAPGVLANDSHPLGLPLSAVVVSNCPVGSVTLNSSGGFTYQPAAGYVGADSFVYGATDGTNSSSPATVTIGVTPAPLKIQDFKALSAGSGDYRIEWNSRADRVYNILSSSNLTGEWAAIATNLPGTPPKNVSVLNRLFKTSEAFRLMEMDTNGWPNTDYCAMLSHDIQGKEHAFLAGNAVYYVGGQYAVWNLQENETIGLTHPFRNDLRSRGYGMVTNALTGYGHDLQGWELYRDTKIAYGTVIIGATQYPNPVPSKMYWRPDRVICEYSVGGVSIREEKFIATNDVACSIITASSPIQIRFSGQSYVNNSRSIARTSTQSYDSTNNMIQVVEGGTILVRPQEGVDVTGKLMYDGMSTVVSASKNFATNYSGFKDGNGRQQYSFTVSCDTNGVAVCWAMDDLYANARSRVQSVLNDPKGHLNAKQARMNDLLNNQIPYFRCSDPQMVNVYYYLWSIYLMYYTDIKQGWEQHPHTQTAVNNFLGMHRFDANFQIKVGAWTRDKDYYAYGNVLIWKALLPYAQSGGQLPDNMGQSWFSPYWETAIEHVVGAWDIYEHTGDTNFLNACYVPYFKPLFWNGANDIWGAKYDGAESLKKMAAATGNSGDSNHWHTVMNVSGMDAWMNAEWQKQGVTNWFGGRGPAYYPTGATKQILYWSGMAYMRNNWFPDTWAAAMTREWAVDSVKGFNGPVPITLVAMQDIAHVFPDFAAAPDIAYFSIIGMYKHHVGTNANLVALRHLKNYNLRWGIPVAPESYDSTWDIWGDQFSNFNAGKILFFLEGFAGLDYSIPDNTFTVADNMPNEWSYMQIKVPLKKNGQTYWVDVRMDRASKAAGVVEKTITVTGNPLETLQIQPWLEERPLVSAPEGYGSQPTGHLGYAFTNTTSKTITIGLQY